VLGFAVFFAGLNNPFQGDDFQQIVYNPTVHTVSNVNVLFEGGTFYNGQGANKSLTGLYYRPLMSVTYSMIYAIFGPHQFYFHLTQLLLCIGSAILLFLFFRYSFAALLSLVLALVFLVHPVNSQVVFAIPSMQDALFFFFGILAMWLLLRFHSVKSLALVTLCLFLSLLSKEAGLLFVIVSLLYLVWFDRRRLWPLLGFLVLPLGTWLFLKAHAVGLVGTNPHLGPVDSLNAMSRIMNYPSILLFFATKFIFPWKLATGYYWAYRSFSFDHVLLPILIDLMIIGAFIWSTLLIRQKASKEQYFTYLFFASWAGFGLLAYSQIVPLDMTVCETWFYFSMAGLLGMLGVILVTFQAKINPVLFVFLALLIVGTLGVRTAIRGTDYRSEHALALHDIAASNEDYTAYNLIAADYISQDNFNEAKLYAARSVSIFPTWTNYDNLGLALTGLGQYNAAASAYINSLQRNALSSAYENTATLALVYGTPAGGKHLLFVLIQKFPKDSTLWLYLALFYGEHNDNADAKFAIQQAASYGQVPQDIYNGIMSNKTFPVALNGLGKSIIVQ
jgi:hypothetical protein